MVGISPPPRCAGPGQQDRVWVLDVEGTLVTIDMGKYDGTPALVVQDLERMARSIRLVLP